MRRAGCHTSRISARARSLEEGFRVIVFHQMWVGTPLMPKASNCRPKRRSKDNGQGAAHVCAYAAYVVAAARTYLAPVCVEAPQSMGRPDPLAMRGIHNSFQPLDAALVVAADLG